MPRGVSSSPQPLGLLLCVTVTAVSVPILNGSGSGSDDPVVEVIAEASEDHQTEATALLLDAEAEELFDAGAQDEDLPLSAGFAVAGAEVGEWPTIIVSRATGSLAKDAAPGQVELESASADEPSSASGSSTTRTPTTNSPATNPPATKASPTTKAPATAAPTTQTPTTQTPATQTPTTQAPATAAPTTAAPVTEAAADSASGEPTAAQWEALRQCEAWGDYTVVSSNGLYYGAYQFGTRTWDALAAAVGRDDLVGVLPSDASPADQDMMALELWRRRGWAPWPTCGRDAIAAG